MFIIRLALHIGELPRELGSRITNSDLVELIAFTELWPWGEDAADARGASIATTVANFCQQARRPKRFKLSQFLPFKRGGQDSKIKPKNKAEAVKMLHAIFGTKRG